MNQSTQSKRALATAGQRLSGRASMLILTMVIPLLALGLLLAVATPATAACGGTTNVATEAQLNAAITAFNGGGAGCNFTIAFTADITLTGDPHEIDNASATSRMLIEGNGHILDGNGVGETLSTDFFSENPLTVDNLIISNSADRGIKADGPLTVTRSTIRNSADHGILISDDPGVILTTTVANGAQTGIVGLVDGATLTIRDSSVYGNGSSGIFAGFKLTMTNSTVHDSGLHGVTLGFTPATILNSTISGSASTGLVSAAGTTLQNSVLADNNENCAGNLTSTNSFFDDATFSCAVVNGVGGNIVGQPAYLGPLQNNGGPTFSRQLLDLSGLISFTSPAIDAGSNGLATGWPSTSAARASPVSSTAQSTWARSKAPGPSPAPPTAS